MKLEQHREFSKSMLQALTDKLYKVPELSENDLCIYTTGSYGRLEASKNSDIDLFFIDPFANRPTSNIDKTLVNAEIIKICRSMGLPEFSKDGMYLTVHKLHEIINNLGSPDDDFNNFFTARMLLLLESQPLYNNELYIECLNRIINSYYIDFNEHNKNFKPIYLTNDIIRFWKTLCLNYEHRRRRKNIKEEHSENTVKIVAHSINLKLKFSRKLTCFSFILKLVSGENVVDQNDVLKIALMTPTQRLESIKENNHLVSKKIDTALESYQWFLDRTQIPSTDMLDWIAIKEERDLAFEKSRQFGFELFEILQDIDTQQILPKLLI